MLAYRVGSSSTHPWGVETVIYIEDDGKVVRSVTVMQWPKDEKFQAARGAKLIQNYLDGLAEQAKPSLTLERAAVEELLVAKGILKVGERVEDVKSATELSRA